MLGYLHTRAVPIIFRDLKPLNIMVTPDDNIYLIDFGIARLFKVGKTKDTVAYVSVGYAAPEQFGRAQTSPQSDIYSLGATLHQLLSGSEPSSNLPLFTFKPLQSYNPNIPTALSQLVAKMVNTDPVLRPMSMVAIRQELERIQIQVKQPSMQQPLTQHAIPLPSHISILSPVVQKQQQLYYTPSGQIPAKPVLPKGKAWKTLSIGIVTGTLAFVFSLLSLGWLTLIIAITLFWIAGLITRKIAVLRKMGFFVGVIATVIWCIIESITSPYLYSYHTQGGIVTIFAYLSLLCLIGGFISWLGAMLAVS